MTRLLHPRQWPLRAQVRVAVCAVIGLLAVGSAEVMSRHDARQAEAEAGQALQQTARHMADRLSDEMAARARDVLVLSELDVLRTADDPEATRHALEKLRGQMPVFSWLGLTDHEGTVVASTGDILLGQSIAKRPVYLNGLKGLWTGDVHEAVLLARLVQHPPGETVRFVDVAAPVRDAAGGTRGVLAMHLSWQWADELRQTVLRPRGAARTQQLMIFNADGQMLLPPERGVQDLSLAPPRLAALSDRWGSEAWSDGRIAMTAVAESNASGDFRGFGWRVAVRDTATAAPLLLHAARRDAYAWALGLGALCAAMACWAIGRVVAPVERLARSLGDGETGSTPPGAPRTQRRSDVQQIAAAVARLQKTVRERDETVTELSDKADRDPLTMLWNRARLSAVSADLEQQLALPVPPLDHCILCIDLDGFKGVNDRYGHGAGDDVLVQVARRLRQAAREGDLLFRLGGDEFLMLLPCEPGEAPAVARQVAARVLAELQRPMSYRTLSNLRINGSIGGAVWPTHGDTVAEAIGRADEALYAAKQSGRGQFRPYAGSAPAAAASAPHFTA